MGFWGLAPRGDFQDHNLFILRKRPKTPLYVYQTLKVVPPTSSLDIFSLDLNELDGQKRFLSTHKLRAIQKYTTTRVRCHS